MKHILITILIIGTMIGFVLAQGKIISGAGRSSEYPTYSPSSPPPLTLSQAYRMALTNIGSATNSFHCVSASCLEMTNNGETGWNFSFFNTNGQRGRVVVYFDGEVEIAAEPGEVLINQQK
jgi:hypothetical protein